MPKRDLICHPDGTVNSEFEGCQPSCQHNSNSETGLPEKKKPPWNRKKKKEMRNDIRSARPEEAVL
jgi:hypothetical protein